MTYEEFRFVIGKTMSDYSMARYTGFSRPKPVPVPEEPKEPVPEEPNDGQTSQKSYVETPLLMPFRRLPLSC